MTMLVYAKVGRTWTLARLSAFPFLPLSLGVERLAGGSYKRRILTPSLAITVTNDIISCQNVMGLLCLPVALHLRLLSMSVDSAGGRQ